MSPRSALALFLEYFYEYFVLFYFAVLNLLYVLFGYLGLRQIVVYSRQLSQMALKDLLERDTYKPVSLLVPAYNEEKSIVASVESLLALQYPKLEVVVVSDGSTDRSLQRLKDSFGLIEERHLFRTSVPTKPVRGIFRSIRHPQLVVVDKVNGGKSDALNAALNVARYPLFAAIDADSVLDPEAILRASRLFVQDETLIAVGGTVRPLNSTVLRDGRAQEMRLPKRWIERFQVLEYARSFFTGRAGWSSLGSLLIISGAFGLFRRDVVLRAGGYRTDTVSEDMELVMRLHQFHLDNGIPYRVSFTPDPICWTEVPSDFKSLRRQRNRWQRGLLEVLWMHRSLLFRRGSGRLGWLGLPYFWLFEAFAPVVEVLGYIMLPVSFFLDFLFPRFAILFLLLAILYGMLLSQLAVGIETLLLSRYSSFKDRLLLIAASLLEFAGFRQILVFERLLASFQVLHKRGQWGSMSRVGIPSAEEPPPDELDEDSRRAS